MIKVTFDTKEVKREMRKIQNNVRKPKKMLQNIARHEIYAAQHRIRTRKVDPDGRPWRPWAFATLVSRLREGNAARGLLYRSGLLARSFYSKITQRRLMISNRAPYAGFLQNGTRNMPARPFLGWGRRARDAAERNVVEYLRKRR